MTEMRRLAALLVSSHDASFPSAHAIPESVARLSVAVAPASMGEALRGAVSAERVRLVWSNASGRGIRCVFEGGWKAEGGSVRLEGRFVPATGTRRYLKAISFVLTVLLAACAYAFFAPDADTGSRVLAFVTITIALVVFPFVVVALGSGRDAEEAQIARSLGRVLAADGEAPAMKPRQKWADEED